MSFTFIWYYIFVFWLLKVNYHQNIYCHGFLFTLITLGTSKILVTNSGLNTGQQVTFMNDNLERVLLANWKQAHAVVPKRKYTITTLHSPWEKDEKRKGSFTDLGRKVGKCMTPLSNPAQPFILWQNRWQLLHLFIY